MSQRPPRPRRGRKQLSARLAAWGAGALAVLTLFGSAVAGADKFASSVGHILDTLGAGSILHGFKHEAPEQLAVEAAIDWRPIVPPQNHHVLVAAFASSGDGLQHIFVGSGTGAIDEYWFGEGGKDSGHRSYQLQTETPGVQIIDLAAYYSAFDGMNHVVVLDSKGIIRDASYAPGRGQPAFRKLETVANAVKLAAAPSEETQEQKVVVAVAGEKKTIKLLTFDDRGDHLKEKDTDLDTLDRVEDLAAFWAPSSGRVHVLVVSGDSSDTTVRDYWTSASGADKRVLDLGQVGQRVIGFETGGGAYLTIAIAGVKTGLQTTKVGEASTRADDPETELKGLQIADLAGYYYLGDSYRHIIMASTNGGVYEVWFRS